jgi:hypothetical protein
MKFNNLQILIFIGLTTLLLPGVVSATSGVASPWTVYFDIDGYQIPNDLAHYNSSYVANTNPSTTVYEWYFISAIGLIFLTLGLIMTQRKEAKDIDIIFMLFGTMASLISAMTSNAIDIVTSYGVASLEEVTNATTFATGASAGATQYTFTNNTHEFVSMSGHTIYNFNMTGLFMWMVVCIGVLCIFAAYMRRSVKEIEKPER